MLVVAINQSAGVKGHPTSSVLWRARVALANPRLAWAFVRRHARIKELTGARKDTIRAYYLEMDQSWLRSQVAEKLSQYSEFGLGFCGRAPELYVLTRIVKPEIVVETGVGNGVSSTFILSALDKNGTGRLISVDLPDPGIGDVLPPTKKTGWLVPDKLRSRWELKMGRSLDLLPDLLEGAKLIDFFLHDSDHSYEYMGAELRLAWPFLRDHGIMLADDAWQNTAFDEFAAEVGRRLVMIANVGGIRK